MILNNETKIGIMVAGVVLALGFLTWKAGDFHVSRKGYTVKVIFNDIDGVALNAPVRLNGLEVGLVKDIEINYGQETKMEALVWLEDSAKLRQGAKGYVKNMGLLGEKYIGLTAGDANAPYLGEGAVVMGEDPADFQKLLAEGQEVAVHLNEISANISERLKTNKEAIDSIVANINTTTAKLASISENVEERMAVNRDMIDEIIANLHGVSTNMEELSFDLKENPWKLLYKEKTGKGK